MDRGAGDEYPPIEMVVIDEPDDEPVRVGAWIAGMVSGDAWPFRDRPVTVTCLGMIVQRAAADKENLAKLAKVSIARGGVDEAFEFLTSETDPAVDICTADELVRLCYSMRDTRTPYKFEWPDDEDRLGYAGLETAFLYELGYTRWFVREVRVVGRGDIEYARWTADELVAAVAEMRRRDSGRAALVDPAEFPGGDGEI